MPDWLAYLQGRPFAFSDAWAETTPYRADDYVYMGRLIYRAIVDNTGVEPASAADAGNIWTQVLDASLGPPRGWLDTAEVDARIVLLRPNPYTTTDKNKLRDVEERATADQTGTEIVALLEALTGSERLPYSALDGVPRERWRGEWQSGDTYARADLVQWAGHLWICRTDNFLSTTGPDGDTANWDPISLYRGEWTNGWFEPGDIVRDPADQNIYMSIAPARNSGAPSTDDDRWLRLSNAFRGGWVGGLRYMMGDIVTHSDIFFICQTDNLRTHRGPFADADNWTPVNLFFAEWENRHYQGGVIVKHNGELYQSYSNVAGGSPAPDAANNTLWKRLSNPTNAELDSRISSWARAGNADLIPDDKVPDPTAQQVLDALDDLAIVGTISRHRLPPEAFAWKGVWDSSAVYLPGAVVIHDEALWFWSHEDAYSIGREPSRADTDHTYEWTQLADLNHPVVDWAEDGNTDTIPSSKIATLDIDSRIALWARAFGASGVAPPGRLGSGERTGSGYLRDDGVWSALPDPTARQVLDALDNLAVPGTIDRLRLPPEAFAWKGDWNADTVYFPGAVVLHETSLWIWSNDAFSVGREPGTSGATEWTRLTEPTASRSLYRGQWASGAEYEIHDIVHYNIGATANPGRLYRRLTEGAGTTAPPISTDWVEVSDYHGDWVIAHYGAGDIVSRSGHIYLCHSVSPNPSNDPATSPSYWTRIDALSSSEVDGRIATWARNGNAATIPLSKLGSGTPDQSVFLRGDGAWAQPPMGSAEDGGEVNVQADWNETDSTSDAYVRNKPTIQQPAPWAINGNGSLIPASKLVNAPGEANVQADWLEADAGHDAHILNKPSIPGDSEIDARIAPWARAGQTEPSGAGEVNVQADWTETDSNSDAYIANKPVATAAWAESGNADAIPADKLTNAPGGEMNVQADWAEPSTSAHAYIRNKPAIPGNAEIDARIASWARAGQSAPDGEANVQVDWAETDTESDAHILNKPAIPGDAEIDARIAPWARAGQDAPEGTGEVNVQVDWDEDDSNSDAFIQNKPTLFSGAYADLTGRPSIPAAQVNADWNASGDVAEILNKPAIPGNDDIDARIAPWARAGQSEPSGTGEVNVQANWAETDANSDAFIQNKPTIPSAAANWAEDGNADAIPLAKLANAPGEANVQPDWNQSDADSDSYIQNKPALFSGSFDDLTNKPTIPAAQVNADWSATSGIAQILNKPVIPTERWKGNWSAGAYAIGNVVKDTQDSQIYFCMESTTGTDTDRPGTDSTHWLRISVLLGDEIADLLDALTGNDRLQYSSLRGAPAIPAAQVNADWNATSGVAEILNKPTIPSVPAGLAAISELFDGSLTVGHTSSAQVGTITVPESGLVRLVCCQLEVGGVAEVPAACLRASRETGRLGRIWAGGGGFGFIAFYSDTNNRLHVRNDVGVGFSNMRLIVRHIDDGTP